MRTTATVIKFGFRDFARFIDGFRIEGHVFILNQLFLV